MNPAPPPAASDRSQDPSDQPAADAPLAEHARSALRTRLRDTITAVLGVGTALRRRLGKKARGTQGTPEGQEKDGDRLESGQDEAATLHHASAPAADTPAEAPRPNRRLRAALVPVGILLAGCIGGGALAYTLLQQHLGQQLKESQHREAALSKKNQPAADIRKALEDEKARRIKAEEKVAEFAKSAADKQAQLDAAEKHPAVLRIAEGPRTDGHGSPSLRSGDCTLDPKNIGALKRCIEEFNR